MSWIFHSSNCLSILNISAVTHWNTFWSPLYWKIMNKASINIYSYVFGWILMKWLQSRVTVGSYGKSAYIFPLPLRVQYNFIISLSSLQTLQRALLCSLSNLCHFSSWILVMWTYYICIHIFWNIAYSICVTLAV